ncbi:entericidin A/B family lipoprotein [Kushneria aurantia]|uniref:Entericidin A/B family lipoprotein n=1 Tax=Kushneria aurantia TaxID=504092 RepID=A0ABV6G1V3_9GAMM|nr:entericidin A/B family lipoprotein [Kushneria aurantia]
MKKLTMTLLALMMAGSVLAGCNTMHGAGEDISEGGEAIQNASQ